MMNRCYTASNKDYAAVGGAGIKVHQAWHDFATFERDMGERPDNTFLRRLHNTLDFAPGNVVWEQKVDSRRDSRYGIWKGIRRRCGVIGEATSGNQERYRDRGITMHPAWADSFIAFADAVGTRPSDKHQIDRIDNDRGYEPGNVRWVSQKTNANNQSNNVIIEMHGARRTLQEWCEFYGVDRTLVGGRWRTLFTPAQARSQSVVQRTREGEVVMEYSGVKAAAEATGIKQGTIAKCLSGGNDSAGGFRWSYG